MHRRWCGQRLDSVDERLGRQKPHETLAVRVVVLVKLQSKPIRHAAHFRAPVASSMASLMFRPRSSKKLGWQVHELESAWPVPMVVVLKGHGSHASLCDWLGLGEKVPIGQPEMRPEAHQEPGGQYVQSDSEVSPVPLP